MFLKNFIAIDIGASSGRFIRGTIKKTRVDLIEIHRFENKLINEEKGCFWDLDNLISELKKGLKIITSDGQKPESIGIDTWGVDYVLIGNNGEPLNKPFSYRDSRTDGIMAELFSIIPKKELYAKTGVQFAKYNTLIQLFAEVKNRPYIFKETSSILMIPDYLNYFFTGIKSNEFTNATTTQMLNVNSGTWDVQLLDLLGISRSLFCEPVKPGTMLGPLKQDIQQETGLSDVPVVLPATHDTGSAIVSIPAKGDNWAFISLGTWSIMGIEVIQPIYSEQAYKYNFSNEGGYGDTYSVLKNLPGLWLFNRLRDEFEPTLSNEEFCKLAYEAKPLQTFIDVEDPLFFNPESMFMAIDEYCLQTGQVPPISIGAYVRCVLEGLSFVYKQSLDQLRKISPKPIDSIHIVGGGSNNSLLCQITSNSTGLSVKAGPVEGTALGNILVQAITNGQIGNLEKAREVVRNSFDVIEYNPVDEQVWEEAWESFQKVKSRKIVGYKYI
jgi:rhamnulokinase